MISELCGDESLANTNCQTIEIFECLGSISIANCKSRLNETDNNEINSTFNNHLIVLEFLHNFTNILNGSAYFVYSSDNNNGRLDRTMEVRFRQLEEMRTPHHSVSGNIGYQMGKPIIISFWTRNNASDEHSPIIANYFHSNNTQHDNVNQLLRFPEFSQNECSLNNETYETISFGQDFFLKCDVRFERNHTESTTATSNLIMLCQQFQTTIYKYILNDVRQKEPRFDFIVSALGNPKNVSNQWIRLEQDSSAIGLSEIKGVAEDGGFRCRNIVLGVGYVFETARLRVNAQPHQNRIMAAKIRMGDKVDLKFGWDEEVWRVPVFVDAIFLDMTGKSGRLSSSSLMVMFVFVVAFILVINHRIV